MIDKYTTETAALKATVGKFRKLDADKLTIKGQDISELIGTCGGNGGSGSVTIKHAQDTRETVTENDLWGQWVETKADGTVIIHDKDINNPNKPQNVSYKHGNYTWNMQITKVQDNKAYIGNDFQANIQTGKIKDGGYMFYTELSSFDSNLDSLVNGDRMFSESKLTKFEIDMPSLTNGTNMFYDCESLTHFYSNLPSLVDGTCMFQECNALENFYSDLFSLTDGYYMFYNTSLSSFTSKSDLQNLVRGDYMFGETDLTQFYYQMPSLVTGKQMFFNCNNLKSFYSSLSNLTDGQDMFFGCNNLTQFKVNLPSLIDGGHMFSNTGIKLFISDLGSLINGTSMFSSCQNLVLFSSELPNLTNGQYMFYICNNLTQFNSNLSSLIYSCSMFNSCSKLTTFTSDLGSLINGTSMFNSCSKLTTFTSDLGSLINGTSMFSGCKLNPQSVMFIANSITDIVAEKKLYTDGVKPYVSALSGANAFTAEKGFRSDGAYLYMNGTSPNIMGSASIGKITIGIDVTNNSSTIAQQLQTFAEGALFDSWDNLKQAFVDKGWTVTWQYGGTGTSITYDLRGGERIIPCPVYTKLIEISPEGVELDENNMPVGDKFYTKEQKNGAEYCNEDGTRYYNIEWGHEVTNPEEFQQFDSLETACVSYGVMPKEYLETEGQATLF